MQLSRYFTLEELTKSSTAAAQGINNIPDTFSQGNLQALASLLDAIYTQIGPFSVSSGYRSPALNVAVGGAEGSLHQRGMAADVIPETMTPEQFFWKLALSPLRNSCGEIINEANEKGVVHISLPYERGTGILKYLAGGSYFLYPNTEIENKGGSPNVSSAAFDIPVLPVLLTAAVLGGLAFMVTLNQTRPA